MDAIDYSENMIQTAREKASIKRLTNISYSCETLAENAAIDKPYDIVTALYERFWSDRGNAWAFRGSWPDTIHEQVVCNFD